MSTAVYQNIGSSLYVDTNQKGGYTDGELPLSQRRLRETEYLHTQNVSKIYHGKLSRFGYHLFGFS